MGADAPFEVSGRGRAEHSMPCPHILGRLAKGYYEPDIETGRLIYLILPSWRWLRLGLYAKPSGG